MKAIIISIKPKWCATIMNGEKTIEVRKENVGKAVQKLIDEQGFADIYVYCTKEKPRAILTDKGCIVANTLTVGGNSQYKSGYSLSGKVVFKFRCYKVEEIKNNLAMRFFTKSSNEKELLEKSCLNSDQLFWYLAPQELKAKCCGYAIYINDLEIFDIPKEISEFYKVGFDKALKESLNSKPYPVSSACIKKQYQLTKAPQSFAYIEVENKDE